MMTVLCRSSFLASEFVAIADLNTIVAYSGAEDGSNPRYSDEWLMENLRNNEVSLVVYEPRFFVDPAPFRAVSPRTRFVVLAGPGDEQNARTALVCGACAIIEKPFATRNVCEVLSLVAG